jgi:hypothetical protein
MLRRLKEQEEAAAADKDSERSVASVGSDEGATGDLDEDFDKLRARPRQPHACAACVCLCDALTPRAVDPAEEDAEYDAMLAQRRSVLAALESRAAGAAGADDDDDDDDLCRDEWTDDEEVESALDDVDVFSMLVAAMNSMQEREAHRYQVRCVRQLRHSHSVSTARGGCSAPAGC